MAEVRRLAETLRQSLATLDEQIEQRAREIVAEYASHHEYRKEWRP